MQTITQTCSAFYEQFKWRKAKKDLARMSFQASLFSQILPFTWTDNKSTAILAVNVRILQGIKKKKKGIQLTQSQYSKSNKIINI